MTSRYSASCVALPGRCGWSTRGDPPGVRSMGGTGTGCAKAPSGPLPPRRAVAASTMKSLKAVCGPVGRPDACRATKCVRAASLAAYSDTGPGCSLMPRASPRALQGRACRSRASACTPCSAHELAYSRLYMSSLGSCPWSPSTSTSSELMSTLSAMMTTACCITPALPKPRTPACSCAPWYIWVQRLVECSDPQRASGTSQIMSLASHPASCRCASSAAAAASSRGAPAAGASPLLPQASSWPLVRATGVTSTNASFPSPVADLWIACMFVQLTVLLGLLPLTDPAWLVYTSRPMACIRLSSTATTLLVLLEC
mmetsp:Transcript_29350/g.74794  ORF Transcript_29350/g.74794 Transcript_29350/m.74794 type:complete len:314 (-) Transcript_29350:153-1094(-)